MQQSLAGSFQHLGTDYLDSYLLHGPAGAQGIHAADWETWGAMEDACREGKVRFLGISNVSCEQLIELHQGARIKPAFVQNRCFAEKRWDKEIRAFCTQNGITYQGFSLLTANSKFLGGEVQRPAGRNIPHLLFDESGAIPPGLPRELRAILEQLGGKTMQQVVFRFARQMGMIPVIGTRSPAHMKLDLEIRDFTLSEMQVQALENVAFLPTGE